MSSRNKFYGLNKKQLKLQRRPLLGYSAENHSYSVACLVELQNEPESDQQALDIYHPFQENLKNLHKIGIINWASAERNDDWISPTKVESRKLNYKWEILKANFAVLCRLLLLFNQLLDKGRKYLDNFLDLTW